MKDNYNIKKNPPKLSSEDISKHKNFDALLEQFNNTAVEKPAAANQPFLRYIGIGGLAVAASLALFFVFRGIYAGDARQDLLGLKKPFSEINLAYANFELDADKGDTLRHSSGSLIVVPASAFVDKNGKAVAGKVEIQYREFDDPIDKFIAGVPQPQQSTLIQSAGMMQIQGFKNGEPVFISKDKELKMELKSTVPAALNLENTVAFALTDKNSGWQEAAKVEIEVLNEGGMLENPSDTLQMPIGTEKNKASFLAELEQKYPMPMKPIEPKKGTPKDMIALGLDFKSKDFPEFAQYENVEWIASKKIVEPLPADGWSDMKVIRLSDMKFEIVMTPNEASKKEGRKEVRFEAFPLIPYTQKSKADYEKALIAYNSAVEARSVKVEAAIAAWEKGEGRFPQIGQQNDQLPKEGFRNIVCRFAVKQFGIWNAGKNFDLNQLAKAKATFKDKNGNNIDVAEVFVADSKRQLYYSAKASDELHFDSENMQLWVMDSKGRLHSSPATPEKEGKGLRFTLLPADIHSAEDIRKVLTI